MIPEEVFYLFLYPWMFMLLIVPGVVMNYLFAGVAINLLNYLPSSKKKESKKS